MSDDDGRVQNILDALLIWPHLGICTAHAVASDNPALLINEPITYSTTLELMIIKILLLL